ncbi:VIT domain-containing protein [Nannocystis pusilla]|uniref:VIT domain-containing protein n=1 Tax=Nannocystis pusilla TaxID=889268 RepID=UPI003B75E91E
MRGKTRGPDDRVAGRRTIPSPSPERSCAVTSRSSSASASPASSPAPAARALRTPPHRHSRSRKASASSSGAPRSSAERRRRPFSLTTQDGTGLKLLSVKSRAVVEDPLAFTELHLAFQNPNDRVIEGRFEINLPPNSAISRFAMLIDGRWQEAEVVELQAARQAYEDFLHRRQDPALLEKSAGNRFSARVFPIPRAASRRSSSPTPRS